MSAKRRRWLRLLALGAVLASAGVGWAIYALEVTEVRVVGTRSLDPNRVVAASGLRGGERILWTQMSGVARRVAAVSAIESVRADRELPGAVVIRIVERGPLVRLDTRPELVADANGVAFPFDRARPLPVLVGWSGRAGEGASLDRASRVVLEAFASLPRGFREGAERVEVGRSVTVVLAGGTEIRFGAPVALEAKVRAALAVLDVAGGRGEELAYVDVRAPNAPASRPKSRPEEPAESPGPHAVGAEGDPQAR